MIYRFLLALVCLILAIPLPLSAENWMVRMPNDGTALLVSPFASANSQAHLPVGTLVSKIGLNDNFVRVSVALPDRKLTGYVFAPYLSRSKPSDPQAKSIQSLLRALGHTSDRPDGQFGPRSRAALARYLQQHALPANTPLKAPLYNHMLLELDKKYAPAREKKLARKRGDALYRQGDCEAFGALGYDARAGRSQDQCAKARQARQNKAEFKQALAAGDCDQAHALNQQLPDPKTYELQKCFDEQGRKKDKHDLVAAMQSLDCAQVSRLQTRLGQTGLARECRIRKAETADSAHSLYMAAGLFDVDNDADAALRLYKKVIQRFPDDPRAIDALNRMTALRDLQEAREQAERQSREIEALRKENEAARRAAETAQRNAQRQATRAASACDQLAVGQTLRYYGAMKNGAATLLQWGTMGSHFKIEGLNRSTGVAHLRSLDTGRYQDVRCRDLSR